MPDRGAARPVFAASETLAAADARATYPGRRPISHPSAVGVVAGGSPGERRWVVGLNDGMAKVLIVEDERSLLRALSMNLAARDYDVTEAPTGTDALTALAGTDF